MTSTNNDSEFDKHTPENAILQAPEFLRTLDAMHRTLFLGLLNQKVIYELVHKDNGRSSKLYASICYVDGYLCLSTKLQESDDVRFYKPDTLVVWQAIRSLMAMLHIEVELPYYRDQQLASPNDALENTSPEYLRHIHHENIRTRLQEALVVANDEGVGLLDYQIEGKRADVRNALGFFSGNREKPLNQSILNLLTTNPSEVIDHRVLNFANYRADSLVLADTKVPQDVLEYYHTHYDVDLEDPTQLRRFRVIRIYMCPVSNPDTYCWYDFMDGSFIMKEELPTTSGDANANE